MSHAALHGCQLLYFTLHFFVMILVLVKVSLLRISLCMQALVVQVVYNLLHLFLCPVHIYLYSDYFSAVVWFPFLKFFTSMKVVFYSMITVVD